MSMGQRRAWNLGANEHRSDAQTKDEEICDTRPLLRHVNEKR